jgi:hypothetical protein
MTDGEAVARYVRSLADFELVEELNLPYNHMNASLVHTVRAERQLRGPVSPLDRPRRRHKVGAPSRLLAVPRALAVGMALATH